MKTKRENRVPQSSRTPEVLAKTRAIADISGLVFPLTTGRVMSDSTLSKLCRENVVGCVPYGMRSSFRDRVDYIVDSIDHE